MAYDEQLVARVREQLDSYPNVDERRMFGGLVFMVDGHFTVGVDRDRLIVRCQKANFDTLTAQPTVGPMDMTPTPPKTFVIVKAPGVRTDPDLARWVASALTTIETLPPKVPTC